MLIFAIETSCDETSAAVVEDGVSVLSNIIASSQDAFRDSGGVIPEEAARKQLESIQPVIDQAFEKAGKTPKDIDAIAVTTHAGLQVSLLVGTMTARTLSALWEKPLIEVNHTLGHVYSTWLRRENVQPDQLQVESSRLQDPSFPILSLSVSGGHTELWYCESHTERTLLGRTRDDAAGEAFDKGAVLLGLPYPGGPSISKASLEGDLNAYHFPLPLKGDKSYDFSFSGLKTSLKYLLRDLESETRRLPAVASAKAGPTPNAQRPNLPDIASSYQNAICLHLLDRLQLAVKNHPKAKEIHLVGGVSANRHLRELVENAFPESIVRWPAEIRFCTDNAAMIGAAAFFQQKG